MGTQGRPDRVARMRVVSGQHGPNNSHFGKAEPARTRVRDETLGGERLAKMRLN